MSVNLRNIQDIVTNNEKMDELKKKSLPIASVFVHSLFALCSLFVRSSFGFICEETAYKLDLNSN